MQAIELPSQYKVTTQKSSDTTCCSGFVFISFRCGRPLSTSPDTKVSSGVFLVEVFLPKMNLLVGVYREGPYVLTLNLYSLLTFKVMRRGKVYANTNTVNSRYILRSNCESKRIIFYLEGQASIEVRSILSFKVIKTFALAQICNELNMSNQFSELISSVDMDYISHLSSIVLLLNTKVVMVQVHKSTSPILVFDNEIEKLCSLHYNSKQRTLLVEGTSSLLLITFDEVGVSSTRLLTSNKLGKASKLLCWNPFEELVVVSQRIAQKREHYHILSYRTENLSVAASVLDVPAYGTYYDEDSQSFLYIEGTEEQQAISRVSLKDFNKNIESFEKPAILEGECMAYIPVTDHQHHSYYMISFREILFVGPHFSNEKVFIK